MRRCHPPCFALIAVAVVTSSGSAYGEESFAPYEAAPVVLPGAESPQDEAAISPGMSVGGLFMQVAAREGVRPSLMAPDEVWQKEDLLQVIVRETSKSRIQQERELQKEGLAKAQVSDFTSFDWGSFFFSPSTSDNLPGFEIGAEKDFDGEGDYQRRDEMTDRITARVVEVKPNGNLVVEARVIRDWSGDRTEIRMTGVVDPEMVTPAKTILSNQVYDLKIEKNHSGPVEDTTQRGFFADVLNFLFAF